MRLSPSSPAYVSPPSDARTSELREPTLRNPARLAALRATGLLDSEVEEVFDRLSRLAVRLLGVPAAFISLVDENRDFYKSACGFGEPLAAAREMSGPTFCHYAAQQTSPLVIPDTAADPVYRDVPTVKTLGVAAYVGIPLVYGGQVIGSFCAIDTQPHAWTVDEVETLGELASSAQREMELRGAVASARAALAVVERQREELEQANRQMQEQALELELQSEELHVTAARLEERTEEAVAANRAKGEFLSMMSHELRTPLNAITGYSELIGMGVHGSVSDGQLEFLGRIRRASKHLQMLISDILDFARVEAGEVQYDLQPVVVGDVLSEATELLAPQLLEAGVQFTRGDCARDIVARADWVKLQQILVNLLTNALKFTPVTGRVSVQCTRVGATVCIEVTDTGRGIPAEHLERVFEPFVQVDRASTPAQHQGVGLGLAICRTFARGMGGDLTAVSEPGQGSVFKLTLPAEMVRPAE